MKRTLAIAALLLVPFLRAETAVMTTDELLPGMRGTGYSVFRGSVPEPFEAEILGVLRKARSGSDLIIARLSGAGLEHSGVIAGMSGSPVYVSNRLIGAVAFSWGFSKDPIAGITPVSDMLGILAYSDPTNDFRSGPSVPWLDPQPERFRRLRTPLAVSGCPDELLERLCTDLEKIGFSPVQAGSSSTDRAVSGPDNLIPGAAVAIRLVTGDLNLSGIGTVTWRDGDRILIFGHPMFQKGPCQFPVAEAEIVTVMPGYDSSFKIGSAGRTVGTTMQDRPHGVSCRIGPVPEMIPVRVTVRRAGQVRESRYGVVRDPRLTPLFSSYAIAAALIRDKTSQEPGSMRVRFRAVLDDGSIVEREDFFTDLTSIANIMGCVGSISGIIDAILLNQYKKVGLVSLDVEAEHSDIIRASEIANLRLLTSGSIRPGDTIRLAVSFAEYKGTVRETNIELTLPPSLPEGPLSLFLSSAAASEEIGFFLAPGLAEPRSWDDLLERIRELPRNDECILWGLTREPGMAVNGERFESLPRSRFRVMQDMKEDIQVPFPVRFKERFRLPFSVAGMKRITVMVQRKIERSE